MKNKFFYAENTLTQELKTGLEPWLFQIAEPISEQIRHVKEDRQAWYVAATTKHYFYTGIEPLNPNVRISKENYPLVLNAIPCDYDIDLSDQRIDEAIAEMKIKPAWVERSLGGNFRLVFIFEQPIRVESYDFCVYVLQQAVKWLGLQRLPELDERAVVNPTRLYCNGGVWRETGHGVIPKSKAHPFLVECVKKFSTPEQSSVVLPMKVAEAELRKKYPALDWPGEFLVGSMGPSFWVEGSLSSNSAIVKEDGMHTFASHATQSKYLWSHPLLLGAEFMEQFKNDAITKATADTYYDKKKYHVLDKETGLYESKDKADFQLYLQYTCNLSNKPNKEGKTAIGEAMNFVQEHAKIESAAPFVLRKPGFFIFNGARRLNNYRRKPIQPATGKQVWGKSGNFPFISMVLENLFKPLNPQLAYFLTWWKHYYQSALEWKPQGGLYISMSGLKSSGKGLVNRHMIGASVGGYVEATSYLVNGSQFNSELFEYPHWSLDDDTPSGSKYVSANVSAALKKMVSNQEHTYSKKYEVPGMTEWMGRIGLTTNLDEKSMQLLISLDVESLDKMCMFRCIHEEADLLTFPDRYEIQTILERELPYFLAWLLEFEVPAFIKYDSRLGILNPYHNPELMEMCHQGSPVATFKEILLGSLKMFWDTNPEQQYAGTATDIYNLLFTNPNNERMLRGYKPEQVNRYIAQLHSQEILQCKSSTDPLTKSRIWIFDRPEQAAPQPSPEPPASDSPNPFAK